jgi:hypothetical protein
VSYQDEPGWVTDLWAELETMEPVQRITTSGDWIVHITQILLPMLGDYRRVQVANLVDEPGWDPRKVAEVVGSRVTAMTRLAREGRAIRVEDSSTVS